MNVRVLYEKPQVIKMPPVRSSLPTDAPVKSLPPKGTAPPKVAQPKGTAPPKVAQPKGTVPPKVAQTKCSPSPQKQHKTPYNSNVCFLCGKEGHYGSQTSCSAANKVKKNYYN